MNVLEWPMLSYYVIYYEKFKNVMQRTEKVALTDITSWRIYIGDTSWPKQSQMEVHCLYLKYGILKYG